MGWTATTRFQHASVARLLRLEGAVRVTSTMVVVILGFVSRVFVQLPHDFVFIASQLENEKSETIPGDGMVLSRKCGAVNYYSTHSSALRWEKKSSFSNFLGPFQTFILT